MQVEEILDSSTESDFELADNDKNGKLDCDGRNGMGSKEDHDMDIDSHLEGSGQ